eukprot:574608-Rhodomonas_salina.2
MVLLINKTRKKVSSFAPPLLFNCGTAPPPRLHLPFTFHFPLFTRSSIAAPRSTQTDFRSRSGDYWLSAVQVCSVRSTARCRATVLLV